MSDQQRNPDDLGALWVKSGPKGEYMTGTVNGVAVVVFPNRSTNPKAPQWRVLKARDRDGQSAAPTREPRPAPQQSTWKGYSKPASASAPAPRQPELPTRRQDPDDDIPW